MNTLLHNEWHGYKLVASTTEDMNSVDPSEFSEWAGLRAPGTGHGPSARGWFWWWCFAGSLRRVHSWTTLRRRQRIFHQHPPASRRCRRATRCGRRRCSHRPCRGSGWSSLRTKATPALRLAHRPVWSRRCESEWRRGPSSGARTLHVATAIRGNSVHFPCVRSRGHRRARWAVEGAARRRQGGRQSRAWVARACEHCSCCVWHTTVPTQARQQRGTDRH
jgi:hypothetical protein